MPLETAETTSADEAAEARRWNHRPDVPLPLNPVFAWPPRPMAVLRWYAGYWLTLSTGTLLLALSLLFWWFLLPPLEAMRELSPGWILQLWLCNLIPHVACAAGLHHWLITRKGQGKESKFDLRDQATKNGQFTFRNQVLDNMFWTIASGITLWTLLQVPVFWAMANGYAPVLYFPENPVLFIAWFILIPMWSSFHFYWVHRALHWPPLYRLAHSLHHRNVNVGPWSGISMHPIEHALFYTNFLIHLVVPSSPLHVLYHGYIQSIHPVFSHSGFEQLRIADKDRAKMGVFFHQLHHRYFECNYGTVEMPWDRWFGSLHDGSGAATAETKARRAKMYGA
ncbi:MAG: sterol desaturase family protein [Pseudomonadota bacterium]